MHSPIAIRIVPATEHHLPLLVDFIRELGEYERLGHEVLTTTGGLHAGLFGQDRMAYAEIAYANDQPAGFALYFFNFSTFLAKPGLYLEDLFVRPAWRRRGIGRELLTRLAHIAEQRGCGRMEWSVLEWNALALGFYRSLGARTLDEWRTCRMTGDAIARLARWSSTRHDDRR